LKAGEEEEEAEECFAEGIVQPLAAAVLGSMRSSPLCRRVTADEERNKHRTTKKACAQRVPIFNPMRARRYSQCTDPKISVIEPEDTLCHCPKIQWTLPEDTVCEARSYLSGCELDPT